MALAQHPSAPFVFSAGLDAVLRQWDLRTGMFYVHASMALHCCSIHFIVCAVANGTATEALARTLSCALLCFFCAVLTGWHCTRRAMRADVHGAHSRHSGAGREP